MAKMPICTWVAIAATTLSAIGVLLSLAIGRILGDIAGRASELLDEQWASGWWSWVRGASGPDTRRRLPRRGGEDCASLDWITTGPDCVLRLCLETWARRTHWGTRPRLQARNRSPNSFEATKSGRRLQRGYISARAGLRVIKNSG